MKILVGNNCFKYKHLLFNFVFVFFGYPILFDSYYRHADVGDDTSGTVILSPHYFYYEPIILGRTVHVIAN
jgi:hypothetical protein